MTHFNISVAVKHRCDDNHIQSKEPVLEEWKNVYDGKPIKG